MRRKAINFVMFQGGWFACVLGAAQGWLVAGCCAMLAYVVLHIACSPDRRGEGIFIAIAACAGTLVDCAMAAGGLIRVGGVHGVHAGLVLWLVSLWAGFATTFNWSMSWAGMKPWAAAVTGAVAGPLAFWAGERLGAVSLHAARWPSLGAIAVEYGAAMPLLFALNARMKNRWGRARV